MVDQMMILEQSDEKSEPKKSKKDGKVLSVLESGEFFGEMALIDDAPRSASAIADKDGTELIVLDKPKFTYMVQQIPDFSLAIMEKLCQRLRETNVKRVSKKGN